MQAHFKPLFASGLLASRWPNRLHSQAQSKGEGKNIVLPTDHTAVSVLSSL